MRRWLAPAWLLAVACAVSYDKPLNRLDDYPQRHELRTQTQLLNEAWPAKYVERGAIWQDCQNLLADLAAAASAEELAAIKERVEKLREQNRSGNYRSWMANWLIELGEWTQESGASSESDSAVRYFEWRLQTGDELQGSVLYRTMDAQTLGILLRGSYLADRRRRVDRVLLALSERLPNEGSALVPYVRLQVGAAQFYVGAFEEAKWSFSSLMKRWPKHPRSEAAAIMLARTSLEQGRLVRSRNALTFRGEQYAPEENPHFAEGAATLERYLKDHPNGKFRSVAEGWLGAFSLELDEPVRALEHYLAQLKAQATREVAASVLQDCDLVFKRVIDAGITREVLASFPYADLARQPVVAMQLLYRLLDPVAADVYEALHHCGEYRMLEWAEGDAGFLSERLAISREASRLLERLSGACAKIERQSDMPGMLRAVMARAAYIRGKYEDALSLSRPDAQGLITPDALHVRAVALFKLGRHAEMLALEERFAQEGVPASFRDEYSYLQAGAWLALGEWGKALVSDLDRGDYVHAIVGRATREQVAGPIGQWSQERGLRAYLTLNLAPMDQLVELREHFRSLRGYLRGQVHDELIKRSIAEGRFATARMWHEQIGELAGHTGAAAARWRDCVEPLIAHASETPPGEPSAQVKWRLELGKLWEKCALGFDLNSLIPNSDLLANASYFQLEADQLESLLLLRSARYQAWITYDQALEMVEDESVERELLERANEVLFRLAEETAFTSRRASVYTEASARYAEKLRLDHAGSTAANAAVAYHIEPRERSDHWSAGSYARFIVDGQMTTLWKSDPVDLRFRFAQQARHQLREANEQLSQADVELSDLADSLEIEIERLEAMPKSTFGGYRAINLLEDLALAARQPGVSLALLRKYFACRQGLVGWHAAAGQDFGVLKSFVAFAQILQIDDRRQRVERWQEFLETYPESAKREAAMVRLIADRVALHTPRPRSRRRPEGDLVLENFPRMDFAVDRAPHAHIVDAIARYRAAFPDGEYVQTVNYHEALYALATGDFELTCQHLDALMDGEVYRPFDQDTGLLLATVGEQLLVHDRRPMVKSALVRHPKLIRFLERLGQRDTFLWRLNPFWRDLSRDAPAL